MRCAVSDSRPYKGQKITSNIHFVDLTWDRSNVTNNIKNRGSKHAIEMDVNVCGGALLDERPGPWPLRPSPNLPV